MTVHLNCLKCGKELSGPFLACSMDDGICDDCFPSLSTFMNAKKLQEESWIDRDPVYYDDEAGKVIDPMARICLRTKESVVAYDEWMERS